MVNAAAVKAKVEAVLSRADLKKTILINYYTLTENSYGEEELEFNYQEPIVDAIVLNYQSVKSKFDELGDFSNSTFVILLKTSVNVTVNDTIEVFDKEYHIVNNTKPTLGAEIIMQRIFVGEKLD